MAIPPSPLEEPLRVLESLASTSTASTSNSGDAVTTTLAALKRIKNALIGNTNRKIEFANREGSVELILRLVQEDSLVVLEAGEAQTRAVFDALSILSSLAIPREECLSVLIRLNIHQTYLRILSALQAGLDRRNTRHDIRYTYLLHTVRAIRSFCMAIQEYIDPSQARAFTYGLIVKSAQVRAKINTPLHGYNPRHATTVNAKSPGKATRSEAEKVPPFRAVAEAFSESMMQPEEVTNIVQLLGEMCYTLTYYSFSSKLRTTIVPTVQQLATSLCEIVAYIVRSQEQQDAVNHVRIPTRDGGFSDVYSLLKSVIDETAPQLSEAAIRALISLMRQYGPLPNKLAVPGRSDSGIAPMFRKSCRGPWLGDLLSHKFSSTRLAATECHVVIHKNAQHAGSAWHSDIGISLLLDTLLQLLGDNVAHIRIRAVLVLASFLDGRRQTQDIANTMDALQRVKGRLAHTFTSLNHPFDDPSYYCTEEKAAEIALEQQGLLLVLSTLCMEIEESRRSIASDSTAMESIVRALESEHSGVRCAAAQCVRSLSRSVNVLKTALLDTNASPILYRLLNPEEDILTHLATTAVLCNVFMEFSPLKSILLETQGLVARIVQLSKPDATGSNPKTHEAQTLLRHHALSAIKNMLYWSSSALKAETVGFMTWEYIVGVLRDSDSLLQAEMLNILRNIACNEAADIDLVVRGIGEARLCSVLEGVLRSPKQELLLQGLFLVCNVGTGTEAHKSAIMNRQGLLKAILTHMSHPSSEVRVAAVWSVANLCPRAELGHRRYNENAQRLRSLGFEVRLKEMREDPSIDVRERVRDALEAGFEPDTGVQGMLVD